ncbi:YciI family protein [Jiangella rhizosphaerae]|uniref:YCII-related domain-containing protein n=1 Tax=Jiangella rhizosphaerae TaxID=2293569 RepID=A0A418KUG6_9ACTN|nr:YciI family protein [Jiangella rhizosphaerae]RIQ32501.1 hypothetical protein DY240_05535 [Jiangella rhizosphaerae]
MRLDEYTVALLVLRDDAPELDDDAASALQNAHLAHLADLHDAGYLLAAGPLEDPRFRGLTILRVDPERAIELESADPAVRAGRFEVRAMRWHVPEGLIHFAPGALPRSVAEVDD